MTEHVGPRHRNSEDLKLRWRNLLGDTSLGEEKEVRSFQHVKFAVPMLQSSIDIQ